MRPHYITLEAICGDKPCFDIEKIIARQHPRELTLHLTIDKTGKTVDAIEYYNNGNN